MRTYTDEFKLKVIEEVNRGLETKGSAQRKYGIKGKSAILNWMRKFEVSGTPAKLQMEDKDNQSPAELQKKIKQLERALEDEQLKAEAYRRIIEKAEQQLNINIRKKSDTK